MNEQLISQLIEECRSGHLSFGRIGREHGSEIRRIVRDRVVALRQDGMEATKPEAVAASKAAASPPCGCDDPRNWEDFPVVEHLADPLHPLSRTIDCVKCPKCGKTHDLYSAVDDLEDDCDY